MLVERIVIDDLIVLGRGCPEQIRNGRITVCTAGYSPTYGFVRIYPTKIDTPIKRWDIVRVPVERNPKDTRRESWKIVGSKREWSRLSEKIEVVGVLPEKERLILVHHLVDKCVNVLNREKRSLGIIKPTIKRCYFSEKEDYDATTQLTLLGYPVFKTRNKYPLVPRIHYRCSGCESRRGHDQQVLEWGFYEWIRKHPDKKEQVWENAKLNSPEHVIYFLVGNLFRHRTRFVIISVLRFPRRPIPRLLQPLIK